MAELFSFLRLAVFTQGAPQRWHFLYAPDRTGYLCRVLKDTEAHFDPIVPSPPWVDLYSGGLEKRMMGMNNSGSTYIAIDQLAIDLWNLVEHTPRDDRWNV